MKKIILLLCFLLCLPLLLLGQSWSYAEATNTVEVTGGTSGSPETLTDFVTADRAGTATELLAATAGLSNPDNTLDDAVRPVEDLAIIIKCIVASKTAEADFIFITGTDWRGAAQTEALDVTAGNGTYTTTKYFATISGLDCSDNNAGGGTVWADGTIQVTQDVWGVIWDFGDSHYRIDARFWIGDASTPTHFKTSNDMVSMAAIAEFYWTVREQAVWYDGDLVNDSGQNGSRFIFNNVSGNFFWANNGDATVKLYGTEITALDGAGGSAPRIYFQSTIDLRDIRINAAATRVFFTPSETITWKDITVEQALSVVLNAAPDNAPVRMFVRNGGTYGFESSNEAVGIEYTFDGAILSDAGTADVGFGQNQTLHFVDGTYGTFAWIGGGGGLLGTFQDEKTCNINVKDKDGNALQGVTVLCEDKNDAQSFSVTTDANGDIAEQNIIFKSAIDNASLVTFTPHKFTLSKTGYQTLIKENITVDDHIVWDLELQKASTLFQGRRRTF